MGEREQHQAWVATIKHRIKEAASMQEVEVLSEELKAQLAAEAQSKARGTVSASTLQYRLRTQANIVSARKPEQQSEHILTAVSPTQMAAPEGHGDSSSSAQQPDVVMEPATEEVGPAGQSCR